MLRTIALLWCSLFVAAAFAQSAPLPKSNIYLFKVKQNEENGKLAFLEPRYLTAFNPNGYNNNPSFFSETELYVSVKPPSAAQADLYKLDLQHKTKLQVTATAETELAPERMPGFYNFSAVRIEKDGRNDIYRLWQFPVDQLTNGKPIFKYINGIQEYLWLNSQEIVIYKEDEEGLSTISIVNTNDDKIDVVATNVGRCMLRLPNGNLAFVQKSRYDDWKIMEKNLYRRREPARPIVETLPSAEHFAALPDGTLLMGKGSKIYRYNSKLGDDNWTEAADLRFYEIQNISRIVVSDNFQVAVVAD